jgi:hypothetical protein
MADPAFPDVPQVPGVPPLASQVPIDGQTLVDHDSPEVAALARTQWGVYDQDGSPVLTPDNILSVEPSYESSISDYPIESGEFRSYNKVTRPLEVRVSMSKGGSLQDRQAFLHKLNNIRPDLELYNVVTPEQTYINVNIEADSQSRSADRGAALITVDLRLKEIRATGEVKFSDTTPGGDTTADANPDGGKPGNAATPKSPTVVAPKSTASARRVSRGSIQSRGPSKAEIARVKKLGFNEQKDGSFVLDLK